MYENETEIAAACFDPNNNNNNNITTIEQNGFSQIIDHNNNNFNNHTSQEMDSTSMELEYQNNNNICYPQYDENIIHTTTSDLLNLLHLPRCSFAPSSSTAFLPPPTPSMSSFVKPSSPPPVNLSFIGDMIVQDNNNNASGSSSLPNISYDPIAAATLPYDPLFHLNLPPQPSPLFRDLMFQSLPHPHGSSIIPTRGNHNNGSLFGHMDDNGDGNNVMNMNMNGLGGLYQENGGIGGEQMMNTNNGMFEFTRGGGSLDEGKLGKGPKNFVTERQRRQNFNDKYATLRSLIPTPTKADRASTVLDAINYINELKMTVRDLKLLVEKKRMSKERIKRLKTEDDDNDNNNNNPSDNAGELNGGNGVEGSAGLVKPDPDDGFVGSSATQLRSSWLQRKCKDTEVDVRIVDDEVTIKLVQRKKINCLLSVSRTLDDLQLDLRHVAGGHVGDYYSYLFNSKICEGSSVYASAIANKLIEVVERQYAAASVAAAPSTSF